MNANMLGGLFWLIGGAGLLYLMMRNGGGCGAHSHGGGAHGHGHGGEEGAGSQHRAPGAPPIDPVCGMPVARVDPALQRSTMSRTFSFCSEDCMRKFDADPAAYARARGDGPRHPAHGC